MKFPEEQEWSQKKFWPSRMVTCLPRGGLSWIIWGLGKGISAFSGWIIYSSEGEGLLCNRYLRTGIFSEQLLLFNQNSAFAVVLKTSAWNKSDYRCLIRLFGGALGRRLIRRNNFLSEGHQRPEFTPSERASIIILRTEPPQPRIIN